MSPAKKSKNRSINSSGFSLYPDDFKKIKEVRVKALTECDIILGKSEALRAIIRVARISDLGKDQFQAVREEVSKRRKAAKRP